MTPKTQAAVKLFQYIDKGISSNNIIMRFLFRTIPILTAPPQINTPNHQVDDSKMTCSST
jgi:hypothetical protein